MLSTRFKIGPLQAGVLFAAAVLYAIFLVLYFPLVSRASRTWELERQKLIAASPVVYVAPYGLKYHQREHYDRLSSPLSLYEATASMDTVQSAASRHRLPSCCGRGMSLIRCSRFSPSRGSI